MVGLTNLVCGVNGCARAFASQRGLDMHRFEVHSPEAAITKAIGEESARILPPEPQLQASAEHEEGEGTMAEHTCREPSCGRKFETVQGLTMHTTRAHRGLGHNAVKKPAGGGIAVKKSSPRRKSQRARRRAPSTANGAGRPDAIITIHAELSPEQFATLSLERIAQFAQETGATITITPLQAARA